MMNTSRDEGRALFEITEAQVQRGAAGMMQRAFVTELRRVNKMERLRYLLVALLREHEPDGTIPTNGRFLFFTSLSSADT